MQTFGVVQLLFLSAQKGARLEAAQKGARLEAALDLGLPYHMYNASGIQILDVSGVLLKGLHTRPWSAKCDGPKSVYITPSPVSFGNLPKFAISL